MIRNLQQGVDANRSQHMHLVVALVCLVAMSDAFLATAAETRDRYYAHAVVLDQHGVIAPWYTGLNGQLDFRIRVAAETLKRYPWTTRDHSIDCVPHFLFSGHWKIAGDGAITPLPISDWDNGDLGQRAAYVLSGLVDYYRYSGDPAAVSLMGLQADFLLDHCLTPDDHPWPRFLISVPIKGKPYAQCDPQGMIQLDIVAEVGLALLKAHQVTGNPRWLEACQQWGDLFAAKRNRTEGSSPWSRYANPEAAPWQDDTQTGGIAFVLYFLDELIRLGYAGADDEIVRARDAGRKYLRDQLLDQWTVNDVWGRNYWDWVDNVQAENVTEFAARYFMDNPDVFPNWRSDARNVLTLFLNHTSVCPNSAGEVFSGAWAFPESSGCCGRSLWYGPMELAVPFAQYGEQAESVWARELARRMQILATYDGHETGVSEDNIDGGFVVNDAWFKIAHPMALKHLLGTMAWLPAELGAARENHIMRTTSVVSSVTYGKGRVRYNTYDAPSGTMDVLRLAFVPERITADDQPLGPSSDLADNGYRVTPLSNSDVLVTIRHDGLTTIVVEGADPQQQVDDGDLQFSGEWNVAEDAADFGGNCRTSDRQGAEVSLTFTGNQARVLGRVAPDGGLADVYLDGEKQLVGIDCWCPQTRQQQILYYRNGLSDGPHSLRFVVRQAQNAKSQGAKVYVDAAQWSAATGSAGYGAGGGPVDKQCMVMGYPGRRDIPDAAGNLWRPGTEFVVRSGTMADSVAASWWTAPAPLPVAATRDAELYRYGVHAREFCANVTVGPGTYYVRLKFAANRRWDTCQNCVSISINGRSMVSRMDVSATAGGTMKAVDLVFNDIQPRNGVIDIRFSGGDKDMSITGEAFVQAIEVGPGPGGESASPVTMLGRNLLRNAGFERWSSDGGNTALEAWRHESDAGSTVILECITSQPDDPEDAGLVAEGMCAARVHEPGASRLVQDVAVRPDSQYRAAALVSAHGLGVAQTSNSSTGSSELVLEEIGPGGRVLVRHCQVATLEADAYRYVSLHVTTKPETTHMRFSLATSLQDPVGSAWISYDHCVLDGPPAPAQIVGLVSDNAGKPVPGALVTVGTQAVKADADGTYLVGSLTDLLQTDIHVSKQGYFNAARVVELKADENHLDLTLVPLSTRNLLANGDFEAGFSAARSMEHGPEGVRDPWRFRFTPGVNCYIYPESIYEWRKPRIHYGQEAISQVTDGGGTMEIYQDVVVDANQPLVASAWVLALDVLGNGQGFGAGSQDFAGVMVQELGLQGSVLVTHQRVGLTAPTRDFQHVRLPFTTGPDTVKVRVILTSTIECLWQKGAAIFDECVLEPAEPAR
ncbi:MAG: hypothetical protein ACYC0X_00700 [Pirellulaceae bacterium]